MPPGRGVTCRFAGTHLYGSPLPETDPREIGARANRMGVNLPYFLQNYRVHLGAPAATSSRPPGSTSRAST